MLILLGVAFTLRCRLLVTVDAFASSVPLVNFKETVAFSSRVVSPLSTFWEGWSLPPAPPWFVTEGWPCTRHWELLADAFSSSGDDDCDWTHTASAFLPRFWSSAVALPGSPLRGQPSPWGQLCGDSTRGECCPRDGCQGKNTFQVDSFRRIYQFKELMESFSNTSTFSKLTQSENVLLSAKHLKTQTQYRRHN